MCQKSDYFSKFSLPVSQINNFKKFCEDLISRIRAKLILAKINPNKVKRNILCMQKSHWHYETIVHNLDLIFLVTYEFVRNREGWIAHLARHRPDNAGVIHVESSNSLRYKYRK